MNNKHYAQQMNLKGKTLAKEYLSKEGELLAHLMQMRKDRLFPQLKFSAIFDYCERELNLSRAQSFYFKSVAEKSEVVPELKEAVVQGELTLSQARRIVAVLTPENQAHWIDQAKTLSQQNLERAVTEVNPKAKIKEKLKPVAKEISELKVPVGPQAEEDLKVLKDVLSQKLGRAATLAEVVAWAVKTCREKFDPEKRAERAANRKTFSSENPPKLGRHRIPAAVKHPVVRRDRNQCTYIGPDGRPCSQKRWLHFHHLIEVAHGGLNTVENITLRCSAHHALAHRHSDG